MNSSIRLLWLSIFAFGLYFSCASQDSLQVLSVVNPFIGTDRMGHTFPGATVPFGAVQLSPDTDTIPYSVNGKYNGKVYEYCAGYQYRDSTIVGFSHTHFSGTGHSDLGDILVMPTQGELQLHPGTADKPETGYRSIFHHDKELASPGYYSVQLEDHDIQAELTATERTGMHRYTFRKKGESHIIVDLVHGIYNYPDKNVWTFVRVENDTLITGYRQTNGWARTRTVYFAIAFSKPFRDYGIVNEDELVYRGFWRRFDQSHHFPENAGHDIRCHFDFDANAGEEVMLKVAISSVSVEGALLNMKTEVPHWNFDVVRTEAESQWSKHLNLVDASFMNDDDKASFYTSLYHTMLGPTMYMDVDGRYRGLDQNIHKCEDFVNYTTFSLWDTYRAQHPLLNLFVPHRNADMIKSMLAHYDQSVHEMLPVWSHYSNENWCMIGYHSVSVIADAIVKGNQMFDWHHALEAMVNTATHGWYDGLEEYMNMGYVPEDMTPNSVSRTLEYAYDDWAISRAALSLNRLDVAEEFSRRALNYRNVFDMSIKFMRPRLSDGSFRAGFDEMDTHGQGFIEGNSWNYSLYVPHDVPGLIGLHGGKKQFETCLDSIFSMELPDRYFENTEDISRDGIMGNYVHGNEPSHHVPYLYNWTDSPHKTQSVVRKVMRAMYKPLPNGLGGNDDLGQMSAWYVFSALGFYPVAPGSPDYQLGSPLVTSAVVHFDNGRDLNIKVVNQSDKNVYVKRVSWNGVIVKSRSLSHDQLMSGGELVFEMSPRPAR